jgi:CubicO group peptidase (beta-lactamase class C family)
MDDLAAFVDGIAQESGFSGAVRVDVAGETLVASAYGFANRAYAVPNTVDGQYGAASGGKGFTALAVMSLVEEGTLALTTTARSLLGDDLPLVDDAVTVEHLLAHRSGIGDYFDEEVHDDVTDYVVDEPVHRLATIEAFVPMLDGHPTAFPPGERFAYCNGGFVLLALLAERASGVEYHDLVLDRVCRPAGLLDTDFLRLDRLPARAARGYLADDPADLQTNVLHLPVRGTGDGGIFTTVADMHRFWVALLAGAIVPPARVADMVRPRSDAPDNDARYGLGFWLDATTNAAYLEGYDAGVSFRSVHDPDRQLTFTVVANTSEGAWPILRRLRAELDATVR